MNKYITYWPYLYPTMWLWYFKKSDSLLTFTVYRREWQNRDRRSVRTRRDSAKNKAAASLPTSRPHCPKIYMVSNHKSIFFSSRVREDLYRVGNIMCNKISLDIDLTPISDIETLLWKIGCTYIQWQVEKKLKMIVLYLEFLSEILT